MDRKMDSGVMIEDESLDYEDYDVTRNVLPHEILGIIDQLLCLEMAWHLGYPLSQTVLTSVYVETLMTPYPQNIDEVNFTRAPPDSSQDSSFLFVLRAYCAGLLRACFIVNECVKQELYFEEEDFVTNTYDRSLLGHIPLSDIKELLQNAITELRVRQQDFPTQVVAALESRLELRVAFLEAVDLSAVKNDSSELPKQPWMRMRRLIETIEGEHIFAEPMSAAFSTKLQRLLASTMPPRPMVNLSFDECITHFKRFFEDGNEVTDVLQDTNPESLLNFILIFQTQNPQPLAFIRTMLQTLMFKDKDTVALDQLLDHDLSIRILPCGPHFDRSFNEIEVTSDPRHKVAAAMEVFRQRVADPYFETWKFLCQNRCRARRLLCHHIELFEAVEADVTDIEEHIQTPIWEVSQGAYPEEDPTYFPLSTWVFLLKLQQMEWIVKLGFELRIYQPDELAGMYYYLNRLTIVRMKKLEEVQKMTARREERARKYLKIPDNSPLPAAATAEFETSKRYQHVSLVETTCTGDLSNALHFLYLALLRLGLVKRPPRPYSTDALRYELRMRPFAPIEDPPLSTWEEFKQRVDMSHLSTANVLRMAETTISTSRKGFEECIRLNEKDAFAINTTAHSHWVGNAKNCLRATIAAGVAVSRLRSAYEKLITRLNDEHAGGTEVDGSGKPDLAKMLGLKVTIPEPGEGYHDGWIVPKLSPV
ncbi:Mak10 subunit, NatC N-terminal acetyltransferase-domain-containing protein [Xylaria venustula]|nr:Mak10 subunit, NatC N-terminal acetyltransferase-domain-containing protein [Xylaria venustula]